MGWTLVNLRWTLAHATPPVRLLPNVVRSPLGLSVNVRTKALVSNASSGTISVSPFPGRRPLAGLRLHAVQ